MRGRRYRSERATAGGRSGLSPVEVISSGTGAGVWLLDSSSSRIQVAVRKFGHLLPLRGQFESVTGMIEIEPGSPARGCLTGDVFLAAGPGVMARPAFTLDFPYIRATLDATIVARLRAPDGPAARRRPATAVCMLHLEFLQQY
jgi:hypothetical protein